MENVWNEGGEGEKIGSVWCVVTEPLLGRDKFSENRIFIARLEVDMETKLLRNAGVSGRISFSEDHRTPGIG